MCKGSDEYGKERSKNNGCVERSIIQVKKKGVQRAEI